MDDLPAFVAQARDGGWLVSVRVQPGAKRDEPVGVVEGRLKVKIKAPAVDNKANEALLAWLAAALRVRKSRLVLESGQSSRKKSVKIQAGPPPAWNGVMETIIDS